MRIFLNILVMVLMSISVPSLQAQISSLPVKTINNKSFYYYEVKRDDTIFSLIDKFGLTKDEIVQSNPAVADGLRAGMVLYFPTQTIALSSERTYTVRHNEGLFSIAHKFGVNPQSITDLNPAAERGVSPGMVLILPPEADVNHTGPLPAMSAPAPVQPTPAPVEDNQMPNQLTPVRTPIVQIHAPESTDEGEEESDEVSDNNADALPVPQMQYAKKSIMLLLPFMLNEEHPSRQAQLYTDFYKGLLLAAEKMKDTPGNEIKIIAIDTRGDDARLHQMLSRPDVKDADIIIPSDSEAQIAAIAHAVVDNEQGNTFVFNVFSVKDTLQYTNPRVVQTNLPQSIMFDKTVEYLLNDFGDCTPLVLRHVGGKNEKEAFVDAASNAFAMRGKMPITIEYSGILDPSQFDVLLPDTRYVVIPTSGSAQDFSKFAGAIKAVKAEMADPSMLAVFGYPDWTAFRGETEEMLGDLDATVYSRFFYNPKSFESIQFDDDYEKWYGDKPMEVVPNQAELGYDVGCYLIKSLRTAGTDNIFGRTDSFTGLQSTFDIRSTANGLTNQALYIIRYLPDGNTFVRIY